VPNISFLGRTCAGQCEEVPALLQAWVAQVKFEEFFMSDLINIKEIIGEDM
jgi:hypothetical protein